MSAPNWDGIFSEPVTIEEFNGTILKSALPAIVIFYSWKCKRCHKIFPLLQELSLQYENKILFFQVNGHADTGLEGKWKIQMYPTILVFKNGEIEMTIQGKTTKEKLENIMEEILKEEKDD